MSYEQKELSLNNNNPSITQTEQNPVKEPSPVKEGKFNPLGKSVRSLKSSKTYTNIDAPILEEVNEEQVEVAIEESKVPQVKKAFTRSLSNTN